MPHNTELDKWIEPVSDQQTVTNVQTQQLLLAEAKRFIAFMLTYDADPACNVLSSHNLHYIMNRLHNSDQVILYVETANNKNYALQVINEHIASCIKQYILGQWRSV